MSGLKAGQRAAFGWDQVNALSECPANVMRVPPEDLLPAWQALQASFRLEYVAGFVRDIVPRETARWFLFQATKFNAEAATLFDKAGARLVADVIVPRSVVDAIVRRKARQAA
ncbi:hypothetical protein [Sphingobium amiense]|uniref:hypothetical protein n=1 Tax=Sphingobium amiense TaxID=135719 RepID=UPI0008372B0B|nr:hypothetical protein [Sphingobium amiense]